MKRAPLILLIPLAACSLGLRHRYAPPKTLEDQQRQNAVIAQKLKNNQSPDANKQPAPAPATVPTDVLSKAQANLAKVERRLRDAFEKSDDYTKANADLKKSQDAYDVAYTTLIAKLSDQPAYAAALQKQSQAESDLAAARADSASPTDTAPLAAKVMDARKSVHEFESDAAGKDDTIKAAKSKVVESKSALDALKKSFEETLKSDPDYVAAKQAVDAARPPKA